MEVKELKLPGCFTYQWEQVDDRAHSIGQYSSAM